MDPTDQVFLQRVSQIPFHGIGLSVDVYTPNVLELIDHLDMNELVYGYLEIFKADQRALQEVRSRRPSIRLEYHADGLWVTQPDWMTSYPFKDELKATTNHLRTLDCSWLNQECASKQICGYSFGTYLPPLFSRSSAQVTARNVEFAQSYLDCLSATNSVRSPLFLLETPPLTYFGIGDISYAEFFCAVADSCSCGFVLDIGHIWTVYRYTRVCAHQSVEQFFEEFLNVFPLERVVQIHIAGLDFHPIVPHDTKGNYRLPNWIDAHDAPIPPVLYDMLDQVLSNSKLMNVKGLAMEVDTKSIDLILKEYAEFLERCGEWEKRQQEETVTTDNQQSLSYTSQMRTNVPRKDEELERCYQEYVRAVTGQESRQSIACSHKEISLDSELVAYYENYLPYEIYKWGGDLKDMFPHTIQALETCGNGLEDFIEFWYAHPQKICEPYDFFLLKIHYFLEYIHLTHPSLLSLSSQEASVLRDGYVLACQQTSTIHS